MNIRDKNALDNETDYRQRRCVLSSMPTVLFLELTQNCNLSCRMCRGIHRAYDPSRDMPIEIVERVLTEIGSYASLINLNGWGESTLRPDFASILRRTIELGARVRLVTNGHAMRTDLWRDLFHSGGIVIVSLDTTRPELHRALGRGELSKVLSALQEGAKIRHQEGRGIICVNMAVNSYTLCEVPAVISLATEMGLDRVLLNPVRCAWESDLHLNRVSNVIPSILEEVAERSKGEARTVVRLGASLSPELAIQSALPQVCSNPWTNAVVDCGGRIGFCHHGIGWTQETLTDQHFPDIWNSRQAVKLRLAHSNGTVSSSHSQCYPKCAWCYANRYGDADFPCSEMAEREVSSRNMLRLYSSVTEG